jgi:hypothetical protein
VQSERRAACAAVKLTVDSTGIVAAEAFAPLPPAVAEHAAQTPLRAQSPGKGLEAGPSELAHVPLDDE